MLQNKTKKAVAVGLSLSMIANFSQQVYASDLVTIPQNNNSVIIPHNSSIIQSHSISFSMKSIESKISNVLKPDKKGAETKVNRKVLATDNSGSYEEGNSGSCGNGVYFTFTAANGFFNIYGSGAMDTSSNVPWESYKASIKSVIINNGITSIPDRTFSRCSNLTQVTIGNSVTYIGKEAFADCEKLTSVVIPDSVTIIGEGAFKGCSDLTSMTIPDSVICIYDLAFYCCKGLTSVTIPDSVTHIGIGAFAGCTGLTEINISDKNTKYKSIDGVIYSKDSSQLIVCSAAKSGSFTISNSVTTICDYAFVDCEGLTSVTIPNSVGTIGEWVFSYCNGLTSVTIPDSVTDIRPGAFSGCSGLTQINISGNNTEYKAINGVIYSKGDDKLISCPAGTGAFTILNGVTSIGECAFQGCYRLTSVTIPNSVTSIGDEVFYDCTNLTSVTIPNSVTSIGDKVFYDCTELTSVTIPDSVTSIGNDAFYGCTKLTSVTIPDSVTSISNNAFIGCSALTAIDVDGNNNNYKSIDGVLYSKDGTQLLAIPAGKTGVYVILDSVTSIDKELFMMGHIEHLSAVFYPSSIEIWGGGMIPMIQYEVIGKYSETGVNKVKLIRMKMYEESAIACDYMGEGYSIVELGNDASLEGKSIVHDMEEVTATDASC